MDAVSRAALVTGCSSGIGRATALAFARAGWPVYATARRVESIADLEREGCRVLRLDVTDHDSCRAAVAAVEQEHGAVGVLVNNAGVNEIGAIETVPLDRVRALFETNLFGMMRLAQLVLPGMRAQGRGRIVNIGSMGGVFTYPGMGAYHATKHAIEAFSDALRLEVRPFGVRVSLIQPGLVRTPFAESASANRSTDADTGPYGDYNARVATAAQEWEGSSFASLSCGPDDVAATVVRAATARSPRARYRVAASARLMIVTRRLLPDAAFDAFLRRLMPVPRATRRR